MANAQLRHLMKIVEALDLNSADGRAGVRALLREIEAVAPSSVEQMTVHLQLRRVGLSGPATH